MHTTTSAPRLTVAVMGAGAVGCYYGGLLARAGHRVTLIGREAHVQAVQAHGLHMQTQTFDEHVSVGASTCAEAVAGADAVLFCVKSPDTEAAGQQIRPHLAPGALVVCLQNGVDNAERLRACLPDHTVLAAVVYVAAEMAGPGHLKHHGRGELILEPGEQADGVAQTLVQALCDAGAPTERSANVRGALWAKLILNCAYNALSAITRLPYGPLVQGAGITDVMQQVVAECRAVAQADGVVLPPDVDEAVRRIAVTMPTQFSSTAQDLMRGKPTEIDHLNGYITRRGQALGMATPVNQTLWSLVRLLQARP